ncbi:MAG: hypothetical protein JWM11_5561, partial [Planctomycetaceae bacterium]|nr:hypothetical protein [Planctomycetaceae bacterium]
MRVIHTLGPSSGRRTKTGPSSPLRAQSATLIHRLPWRLPFLSPDVFELEVAHALTRAERAGRISV